MFPIGDENRRGHIVPWITYLLIVANVFVFLYEVSLGAQSNALEDFIFRYGTVPEEVSRGEDLFTLFTSMFLHGGWSHLLGNMLFLWVFGDNIEDAFGHLGYLFFYLFAGLAASLAQVVSNPDSPVPGIGASGAIAGILGAYLIFFHSNRVRVLIGYFITEVPAWVVLLLWIATQFISVGQITEQPQGAGGVAYWAHIGGFMAGLIVALVLRGRVRPQQRPYRSYSR
ncbi:MAG: rhomboid family intramembrane serine protease [Herpetosiphonaceae bacterium]|nr:MAG: rhomboid family intramembrane serine protease [Herpetosiphonaceae bacterium]